MTAGIAPCTANALWDAYHGTMYIVVVDGHPLQICVDQASPELDAELARRGVTTWAFLTAWNPRSRVLSQAENDRRLAELKDELTRRDFKFAEGKGESPDASWTPEESVLVFGISKAEALESGTRYGQLAILVGQQYRSARLIACGEETWSEEDR